MAELDKELRESGTSLGDRVKLRIRGIKGAFSVATAGFGASTSRAAAMVAEVGGYFVL